MIIFSTHKTKTRKIPKTKMHLNETMAEKHRNNRSAHVNKFSKLLLTDKLRYYLQMNCTSYYWSYIDFYTLTFLYYLHSYLFSMHWLLDHILSFTIHYSTHFSFLQITSCLLCMEVIKGGENISDGLCWVSIKFLVSGGVG